MSEAETRVWRPRARAPWCCPTTGRRASCLSDYFPISDQVLEVEVTPNRPDCLSVRGLAREIAAITEAPFDEDLSFPHPWGDRTVDRGHRHRGARPRSVPALRRPGHPGRHGRASRLCGSRLALCSRGHATHQQRGGRHQLRAVGAGPAAARLRPADHPRAGRSSCAGRTRARASSRSTTSTGR